MSPLPSGRGLAPKEPVGAFKRTSPGWKGARPGEEMQGSRGSPFSPRRARSGCSQPLPGAAAPLARRRPRTRGRGLPPRRRGAGTGTGGGTEPGKGVPEPGEGSTGTPGGWWGHRASRRRAAAAGTAGSLPSAQLSAEWVAPGCPLPGCGTLPCRCSGPPAPPEAAPAGKPRPSSPGERPPSPPAAGGERRSRGALPARGAARGLRPEQRGGPACGGVRACSRRSGVPEPQVTLAGGEGTASGTGGAERDGWRGRSDGAGAGRGFADDTPLLRALWDE